MQKKAKCLLLFSGGLDSILAAKILMDQGIKVLGITFKSCFFDEKQARKSAKEIGLKLKIIDISKEYLELVKKPRYGYGKNMNPCIDCHLLMLKTAKKIAKIRGTVRETTQNSFDFVATGEVLGERPMSQNKNILKLLEKESRLKGYLIRPLSAKLLEETIPEKEGIVDREKFLSISGRQRKIQLELAKKFKIKKYPTPSGGCCLTYKEFSQKLKELFKKWPEADCKDVELLNYGRHIWVKLRNHAEQKCKTTQKNWFLVVAGRDDKDNQKIKKLKNKKDIIVELKTIPGPTTLIHVKNQQIPEAIIEYAKKITKKYSIKAKGKKKIDYTLS